MKTYLTSLLFLFSAQLWGQNQSLDLQQSDEQISMYDYLLNNPINLNDCTEEELHQIYFLNQDQIHSFIAYRSQQGQLLHIFELQVIAHWDVNTCRKIAPFIYINQKLNTKLNLSQSFALIRIEETAEKSIGFEENGKSNSYQGNRLKQFIKLKNSSNKTIKFGFISQKDAGEKNLLDFYSFFIEINPSKIFKKIILGDYSIQWGQGLLQTGGFNLGKNYESIKSTQKFHLGGIPYSSSAEYAYNRGIYLSKNLFNTIHWQTFISNKFLDGKIYSFSNSLGFKSIDTDGYHRNTTEIANQQRIHEFKWGNSLQYHPTKNSQIELNSLYTKYGMPKINSGIDYKKQEWTGNSFQLWSLSYSGTYQNIRIISEIATLNFEAISIIHGWAISNSKKQDLSILLRYFPIGFYNPDGKAFGENTKNENELGVFIGHQYQIAKRKKLSSYVDIFYFPEIKYQVSFPRTFGWEVLNRYQSEKKNKLKFFIQNKWTSKQEDFMSSKSEKSLERIHDLQESMDLTFIGHKNIEFHSRIMLHFLHKNLVSYAGLLYIQDLETKFRKLSLNQRIAYINTPNYDTRLYAFEPGIPYSFNLIAYAGQAIRIATVVDFQLSKSLNFSAKIGRTMYFDRNEIGSGTDIIQKTHKTDLSLQLVYKQL